MSLPVGMKYSLPVTRACWARSPKFSKVSFAGCERSFPKWSLDLGDHPNPSRALARCQFSGRRTDASGGASLSPVATWKLQQHYATPTNIVRDSAAPSALREQACGTIVPAVMACTQVIRALTLLVATL